MASSYEKAPTSPSSPAYLDTQRNPDIVVQSPTSDKMISIEKFQVAEEPNPPSSLPYNDRPVPERKYSKEWFKRSWNVAVRAGRLPRIVYAGVGLCIIAIWFGIMFAFNREEQKYKGNTGRGRTQQDHYPSQPDVASGGQIGLSGSYIQFDAMKHILMVTWTGIYSTDGEKWKPLGDRYDEESASYYVPFGIYRDVEALPWDFYWNSTSESIAKNGSFFTTLEPPSDSSLTLGYMYRVDNLTAAPVGYIGAHKWDSFDTEIGFVQAENGSMWNAPLRSYPFDVWEGSISFSVADTYANTLQHTPGGNVFDLTTVIMKDDTLNWRFDFEAKNTCALKNTTLNWSNYTTFADNCNMEISFKAFRPPVVKFAAVSAVIVNWTSALFIFVLTCEAIVMRRRYMLEGTDILSVCFTALFALPTIRALLPGAPEYGATLDLVGVLPCTVLVALCTVAVAIAKLNKRKHAALGDRRD